LSRPFIFRNGTIATKSFADSLGEVSIQISPKKRASHEAALARQRQLDQAKEEAVALGREEGLEAGQKAGYQAGFDQAYSEGSNQQAEILRAFASDLQQVHDRLEDSIAEWFEAAEKEVEILAVRIAQKLVGAELDMDRSFVIETTKAALQQLTEANKARIRVNPFDSVILNNAREELLAATASLRGVEIVDDASIIGGCVIETDRGAIDATMETRLKLLEGGMEGAA
jgi:flagellar biosynthesis/type III secretory pathway protein FliH